MPLNRAVETAFAVPELAASTSAPAKNLAIFSQRAGVATCRDELFGLNDANRWWRRHLAWVITNVCLSRCIAEI